MADYYEELGEIALGWLGWSEEQALSADVNAIAVGYRGRASMLAAMWGGAHEPENLSPHTLREALGR